MSRRGTPQLSADRLRSVRHDIQDLGIRVAEVDNKLETMDIGYKAIPVLVSEFEAEVANNTHKLDHIHCRTKINATRLRDIQGDLQDVKFERDLLKQETTRSGLPLDRVFRQMTPKDTPRNEDNRHGTPASGASGDHRLGGSHHVDEGRAGMSPEGSRADQRSRESDKQPYYGMERYIDPNAATSYRLEHWPPDFYMSMWDKKEQTQYAEDFNHLQNLQRRQQADWERQKEEERQKFLQDKPLTYNDFPSQNYRPSQNIQDYFGPSHESPRDRQDDYYHQKKIPYVIPENAVGVTTYDSDFVNPKKYDPSKILYFEEPHTHSREHPPPNTPRVSEYMKSLQLFPGDEPGPRTYDVDFINRTPRRGQPGGLYVIKFPDSEYDEAKIALMGLKTVIHSSEGRVLGIARKHTIFLMEGHGAWREAPRNRKGRWGVTDDAVAVVWFASEERANQFTASSFKNRFKWFDNPHQRKKDTFYLPLVSKPVFEAYDTFHIIELHHANRYSAVDLTSFEAEVRQEILKVDADALPFIVSKMMESGPGSGNYGRDMVKVYVSRFDNMRDLEKVWDSGVIQDKLRKFNLTAGLHVYAWSLQD